MALTKINSAGLNINADTASGDDAAVGYTSAEGLIITGQGSTSDVTLKNDADGTVFTVPTGTDDILFPDSAKGMWGAGSDMQLYHDGSNSYITNAVGALKIATETSGIALTIGHTTSETTVADNLTVTGTLSGYSIEMFYRTDGNQQTRGINGYYSASPNGGIDDSAHVYANGIAPTGFSSVSAIYVWWVKEQDTSSGLNLQASWQMGGDGQSYATHSQAEIELTEADAGENFSSSITYRSEIGQDILLDSTVAAGDAFGIRITNTGADDCIIFGISIVWAF